MKLLWSLLKQHIKEDFCKKHYSLVAVLLCICIYFNYKYNLEDGYLDNLRGLKKYLSFLLFYSIPYYITVISYCYFHQSTVFKDRQFWIKSALALSLLSLDSSNPILPGVIKNYFPYDLQYWLYKVFVNAISAIIIIIPILLASIWFNEQEHLYGLKIKKFDVKPYVIMLLLMLPVLVFASFSKSFLNQYPMYKVSSASTYLGVEEWVTALVYEIAYGTDFITVEFLFRGFMVIGLMKFLGRGAVLAMAVVYCLLHFGKPMGEAVSSIIGGYVLGVFAYETRSIWGGIIVHVGIAWMMELFAFLQSD